jgi:uncharacterized protein YifE (UPF0438 family)
MNTEKNKHYEYIKAKVKFTVTCNHAIFSNEEIELLEKYGHWFKALTDGMLLPFNAEQEQFVAVAQMRRVPETLYEKIWFKYIKRKEIESKKGAILYTTPIPEDDKFYSRDMVKKLKSTMFKVVKENHKQ